MRLTENGIAMADLGNHHRLFLQSMMCRNICIASEVRKLYKSCCEKFQINLDFQNANELSQFVNRINFHLRPLHMEIRKGVSEESGDHYYALVNKVETAITRLASDYTTTELEFFKKLVEKIVDSETGMLSSITALNLTDELERKMSKKDAEDIIYRLKEEKWLEGKRGVIALSTRSLIELDQYLKTMYADIITKCHMCEQIVLQGTRCESCDLKMHHHCTGHLFRRQETPKCPSCGAEWTMPRRHGVVRSSSSRDE